MILKARRDGAVSYDVGDEIWQELVADVIRAEVALIASYGRRNGLSAWLRGSTCATGSSAR
ncbi:MAG: hypothetical protein ACYC91_20310 [Solirubrobacteraceae bacterium]